MHEPTKKTGEIISSETQATDVITFPSQINRSYVVADKKTPAIKNARSLKSNGFLPDTLVFAQYFFTGLFATY